MVIGMHEHGEAQHLLWGEVVKLGREQRALVPVGSDHDWRADDLSRLMKQHAMVTAVAAAAGLKTF